MGWNEFGWVSSCKRSVFLLFENESIMSGKFDIKKRGLRTLYFIVDIKIYGKNEGGRPNEKKYYFEPADETVEFTNYYERLKMTQSLGEQLAFY